MSIRVHFLLAILLSLLSSVAVAQSRIEGTVIDGEGRPVAGAVIRVTAPDWAGALTTTSDESGRYRFDQVRSGVRAVLVAMAGQRRIATAYALISLPIENVDIRQNAVNYDATSLDYALTPDGPGGEVAGVVRGDAGQAIEGARVTFGSTPLSTTTDAAGRFLFGGLRDSVRAALHVVAPGYLSANEAVVVAEGERVIANVALRRRAVPMAVATELTTFNSAGGTDRAVAAAEGLAGVPSPYGRESLFRAFQFLPSVNGTVEVPGDVGVRGGTSDQTRLSVDGITLYPSWDRLGALLPYNVDALNQAAFAPDQAAAGEGGRLSGSVRLNETVHGGNRAAGYVDASVFGIATRVDAAIGPKAGLMLAGQRSLTAAAFTEAMGWFGASNGAAVGDRLPAFSSGVLPGASHEPFFGSVNGKLELRPTERDRASVTFFNGRSNANNSRDLALPAASTTLGPADVNSIPEDVVVAGSDVREVQLRGAGVGWSRQWSSAAETTVTVTRSDHESSAGQAWPVTGQLDGGDYSFADNRGGSGGLAEANEIHETKIAVDARVGKGFAHAFAVGGEIVSQEASYDLRRETSTLPGDLVLSSLTPLVSLSRSARTGSVYAADAWRPWRRLIVSPGIRLVHYSAANASFAEPRGSVVYEVAPMVRLKASASIDHQMDLRITREDHLHGDGAFWMLADGMSVPVARAEQASAGAALDLPGGSIEARVFSKRYDDLTIFAPRLYSGLAATDTNRLFHRGTGLARGFELQLQQKLPRQTLWLAYTFNRVDNTFASLESTTFSASNERRQQFKLVDSVVVAPQWTVSAAFVAAGGTPYTAASAIEQVWFPTGTVRQVTFDAKNSSRTSPYSRLDVSTQRDFRLGALRYSLGLAVFNVYDRKNVLFTEYETAGGTALSQEVTAMRRAANVFVRVGF